MAVQWVRRGVQLTIRRQAYLFRDTVIGEAENLADFRNLDPRLVRWLLLRRTG